MIPILCLIIGAVLGWTRAARRGGQTADKLQYAAGHGIAGFLIAMAFVAILGSAGVF